MSACRAGSERPCSRTSQQQQQQASSSSSSSSCCCALYVDHFLGRRSDGHLQHTNGGVAVPGAAAVVAVQTLTLPNAHRNNTRWSPLTTVADSFCLAAAIRCCIDALVRATFCSRSSLQACGRFRFNAAPSGRSAAARRCPNTCILPVGKERQSSRGGGPDECWRRTLAAGSSAPSSRRRASSCL